MENMTDLEKVLAELDQTNDTLEEGLEIKDPASDAIVEGNEELTEEQIAAFDTLIEAEEVTEEVLEENSNLFDLLLAEAIAADGETEESLKEFIEFDEDSEKKEIVAPLKESVAGETDRPNRTIA